MYFCPHLFSTNRRIKETVETTPCAWADLDYCNPSVLLVAPTVVMQTSPSRYQALWFFEEDVPPDDAEQLSKRIAYAHADEGADKTGWDLTQYLRIPFTFNHKYSGVGLQEPPMVTVETINQVSYSMADFEIYPDVDTSLHQRIPYPEPAVLEGMTAESVMEKFRLRIHPNGWHLFQNEPEAHRWSHALWQLEMILFEAGLSREEVFVVVKEAACNKFKRDGRDDRTLWSDVCRAWASYNSTTIGPIQSASGRLEELLTDEEHRQAENIRTLVEEYTDWARSQGDAAWQYHQVGAFVVLSSLLAGNVRLPTSYGLVVPNLWFMILADTTLTRKTTAMDMAMDILLEVDPDSILATDGSIEGLFTSLSMRPGRPSIFLRDEFSGLLEAMTKKDYYAGMAETLTKLYDGKFQKRVLRKEIIEVRDPVLILFAGGIRTRILQLLTTEHVASGFLPRFVFVSAVSDVSKLRPLGPPTDASLGQRGFLLSKFQALHARYTRTNTVTVGGRQVVAPSKIDASLTPDAWSRYNKFESDMLKSAMQMAQADITTPAFDRLSKSGLKVATLLACTRTMEDEVVVQEQDIVKAFSYVEKWREYTVDVLANIGKTAQEKQIETIFGAISKSPGCLRSFVMQTYHLTAREADAILGTLEQRGMITRMRSGRTERLFPIGVVSVKSATN